MGVYPGGRYRPLNEFSNQGTKPRVGVVLHVNASDGPSLYNWIAGDNNMSCHFQVAKSGVCLVPEHRVLRADLRWVPGGDIQVGDRLVGFDEHGGGKRDGRRYRESVVEWVTRDEAEVYAVVMDDETKIYATKEHRWLTKSPNEVWTWRKTVDEAGRTLVEADVPCMIQPWETRTDFDAGWMAGLLDGEGHITERHRVSFAQRPTVVYDRAVSYLKAQGYAITDTLVSGGRGDCRKIDVTGPLSVRLELLGSHRPQRLLDQVDIEKFGAIRASSGTMRRVVAVYPVGVREIVKIQTSTRTFIAEGFGMHNCEQYVDTDNGSWCQMAGNNTYLSIETQGFPSEPLNTAQLNACAGIMRWLHATHGIPLVLADVVGARGLGWHGMGGANWGGHTGCPGSLRKAQRGTILKLAGAPTPQPSPAPIGPHLRRPWPAYMDKDYDYFGLITGPANSHGGYYLSERADVKAIQVRLQQLHYAPTVPGWADGIFGPPTVTAVAAWQRAKWAKYTSLYGQVWYDDWLRLFTY